MADEGTITRLLEQAALGDQRADDELYPLVEAELRNIALGVLKRLSARGKEETTALIDDAYLKLVHGPGQACKTRKQFYVFAARKIHELVIDLIRKIKARARGGNYKQVNQDPDWVADTSESMDKTVTALADLK